MSVRNQSRPAPSAAVTAIGSDHVLLSYQYLDSGDVDGYGSLLDEQAQFTRPDAPPCIGRGEVLRLHRRMSARGERHHVYKTVAEGDCIAVTGRLIRTAAEPGRADVDFADFFTLSDEGLLLGCRRFYFSPPA